MFDIRSGIDIMPFIKQKDYDHYTREREFGILKKKTKQKIFLGCVFD